MLFSKVVCVWFFCFCDSLKQFSLYAAALRVLLAGNGNAQNPQFTLE